MNYVLELEKQLFVICSPTQKDK